MDGDEYPPAWMIGFTKIVGGTASSVAALGEHLWNQTLEKRQADVSAYYHRGMDPGMADASVNDFAPVLRTDMHPIVALGLGIDLQRAITPAEVNGLIAGRTVQGNFIKGKNYAKVRDRGIDPKTGEHLISTPIGSYDFCPSPDKSISVAWAFAPPAEQAQIYEIHLSAAREAVAYIAKKIAVAHAEVDGEVRFEPGHIGWIEFTHFAARRVQVTVEGGETKVTQDAGVPGDPDVHTHFLIPNAVFCESGRVGSLHTGMIEGFIFEADGFYQMRLAQKLNDAGFTADLDPEKKSARLTAVPHDISRLFSKRTNAAELIARKQAQSAGLDWDTLTDDQRTTRTRNAAHTLDQKTKGGKDDKADPENWKAQAKAFGWEPKTFLAQGPPAPELTDEQRHRIAYETSLQFIEKDLGHKSVITHWNLRDAAARGCIHSGTKQGVKDIDAVTQIMREDGVRQYGETTKLVYGHETGERYVSVTTELHEGQEKEFIRLAKKLDADKTWAVPKELIDKHIALSGLTFDGEHGAAQLKMIYRSAEAGRFSLGVAAAGAGKTTAWIPLIAAKKEMGHRVFGASLAWEQADDLVKAGIDPKNLKALSVLLDDIPKMNLGPSDLVAVDEWALLGTRQGLQLLKLADHYGFGITSLGDPKQCNSVEAGNIVKLVKRALPDHVIEIETTIRQKDPEEKRFVGLLRQGRAKEALDIKRDASLAEMVPGDAERLIARTAQLYMRWRTETGIAPSVAAPTNIGAHKISLAIRAEAKKSGVIGEDAKVLRAGDNRGHHYGIALAPGDRIRLFKSTGARFVNGKGGNIGRNKSTLEVKSISEDGIVAQSVRTGSVGFVAWENLIAQHGPSKGRFLIDYAYCKTINSAQGSDSDDHILALPYGSKEINGLSGYSGGTRQKKRLAILTSDVAERLEIVKRRPLNDDRVIDLDAKWANVARNLSYQPAKDLAVDMLDRVETVRRGAVTRFQKTMVAAEQAGHQTTAQRPAPTPPAVAQAIVRDAITPAPVTTVKPQERQAMSAADIQLGFAEALEREGFRLKGAPIMDGQWHNAKYVDGKSLKNGGYSGSDRGGVMHKFRGDQFIHYRPDAPTVSMTAEQRAAQQTADRAARLQAQADRRAREEKVASDAEAAWKAAKPAHPDHAYLKRKQIDGKGLKQGAAGQTVPMTDGKEMRIAGRLLVPLRDDDGKMWNIQVIDKDGGKLFLPGRKKGLSFTSGEMKPDAPVIIAEGMATAKTLYNTTSLTTIAAIDSGNILAVADRIRAKYPHNAIILAADNDHHLPRKEKPTPNVGIAKATDAAAQVGGVVIAPTFATDDKGTDWNDVHVYQGRAAVRKQIEAAFAQQGIAELLPPEQNIRSEAWKAADPIVSNTTMRRQEPTERLNPTQGV